MKKRKHTYFFFALSLLCVVSALILCRVAPAMPTLLIRPSGSAEAAAGDFLSALSRGDYAAASALCTTPLPAEELPAEESTAALYALLKESWSGELLKQTAQEGDQASVRLRLTSLSPSLLLEDIQPEINILLSRYVDEARLASDVYNEDGSYREEVVFRAWEEALRGRMERAERYEQSYELTLHLRYTRHRWLIVPDEALLTALSGKEVDP